MTHYFSKAVMSEEGIKRALMTGGSYDLHRMVWKLFPNVSHGERPFIYCIPDMNKRVAYCVSSILPDSNDIWDVETKEYDPVIPDGTLLRFHLHANPTVSNEKTGKRQRHDVVMDLKKENRESGKQINMADIINQSVSEWICRKGILNGFEPDLKSLSITSYSRNESYKPEKKESIVFSTVDIDGLLLVKDDALFKNALYSGIGSCKGFGCGMLMVKRV